MQEEANAQHFYEREHSEELVEFKATQLTRVLGRNPSFHVRQWTGHFGWFAGSFAWHSHKVGLKNGGTKVRRRQSRSVLKLRNGELWRQGIAIQQSIRMRQYACPPDSGGF